ncbi:MAG: nicotinate (nicotinamide) nucleotide adenylyltransferase [Clostridia bacterium]|nr:nicotinate (nicotinamide) nucleotide adenylyltransferase [Clostridia bacterium]
MKTLVFGGAFDPPHKEHVNICINAMKELGCERLVIVPTMDPPHKNKGFLSFKDRCCLIEKAFDGINFLIDDIENVRGKDNYTCRVLPILKEKYGDIVFLIGGDSFEYFDTWYHPELITEIAPIAVCGREGFDDLNLTKNKMTEKFGGDFIIIDYKGKDISSSMIKAKLLMQENPKELQESVLDYIHENHLYEDYKWMVDKLMTYQSDDLFNHSKFVVKRSVDFNSKHNLKQNFTKVFLAALLHDNAKQRPSLDGFNVPEDAVGTKVLHQFLGAEKARRDFGIEDEEILSAIRHHTTAKENMTMLEKLIYTGDSLSDDREYGEIPKLREIAIKDFNEGFLAILKHTYDKLIAEGRPIYPLTLEAVKYYL